LLDSDRPKTQEGTLLQSGRSADIPSQIGKRLQPPAAQLLSQRNHDQFKPGAAAPPTPAFATDKTGGVDEADRDEKQRQKTAQGSDFSSQKGRSGHPLGFATKPRAASPLAIQGLFICLGAHMEVCRTLLAKARGDVVMMAAINRWLSSALETHWL